MTTDTLKTLLDSLKAASNYIDTLGGVSQSYRTLIAAMEAQQEQEPVISTKHGPWVVSTAPGEEDETHCQRCLLRFKFFGARKCDPHIVYAAPVQTVEPPSIDPRWAGIDYDKVNAELRDYRDQVERLRTYQQSVEAKNG